MKTYKDPNNHWNISTIKVVQKGRLQDEHCHL